jgi:hypothetical protein
MESAGPQQVRVTIGDVQLEPRRFPALAWQTTRWNLAPGKEGPVDVRFEVDPGFRPGNETRVLGLAVGGFGFVP